MKKNRPVQFFTSEYLENCKKLSTEQIVEFLEQYRELIGNQDSKTKAISIRVPENLLEAFKTQSALEGQPYQSRIIELMRKSITRK